MVIVSTVSQVVAMSSVISPAINAGILTIQTGETIVWMTTTAVN